MTLAFRESSFGSRPKRFAHGAIKQIKGYLKEGDRIAVDLDLEKFFDTVCHDALMARVSRKVHDKVLLKLIDRYLRAGVMVDGVVQATEWGTPQGSPVSPMLANVLLDDLDKELEKRGHRFVRYIGKSAEVSGGECPCPGIPRVSISRHSSVLVRESLCGLQTPTEGVNRSQLGSLHGTSPEALEPVLARLDGILWRLAILSLDIRVRQMAEAMDPNVLLETVAPTTHAHSKPLGVRD